MPKIKNYQKEKRWQIADINLSLFKSNKYSSDMIRILALRGVKNEKEADTFLDPDYKKLSDPFDLIDMEKATAIIRKAVSDDERIAIYGDYDVDGVTATAVLVDFFRNIGVETIQYIPSRQDEGYGLNTDAIEFLASEGVHLIITVDCGSTSHNEIKRAKELGMKVIVTDHHTLKSIACETSLPEADAVINPKRNSSDTPTYELAGVGVAFYLVRALVSYYGDKYAPGQEKWLLDLVALGTICDVVPLVGENRILASFGLKVLQKTRRLGIIALAAVAEVNLDHVRSYHVGFLLGPRLNAAGRIEHAKASLELLLTCDQAAAKNIADELNELNLTRQELTERIVAEAKKVIEDDDKDKNLYLLAKKDWPAGVVGIVASRLVEEYGKPMLIMEDLGNELKGSARSIPGFNIIEALSSCSEFMTHFGGHAYAAGFKLNKDKFILLNDKLIQISNDKISEEDLMTKLKIDTTIDLKGVGIDFIDSLERLEPLGRENPKPLFLLKDALIVSARLVGNPPVHLKLTIEQSGTRLDGIAFGYGEELNIINGDVYDLVVNLDINDWNNRRLPQFRVIDLKKSMKEHE